MNFAHSLPLPAGPVLDAPLAGVPGGPSQPLLGRVTGQDLLEMVLGLLVLLVLNRLVITWCRYRLRQAGSGPLRWRWRLAKLAGKPLTLLLWTWCGYYALTTLLGKLPVDSAVLLPQSVLYGLFVLGTSIAWLWLFFRLTHALEAWLVVVAAKSPGKLDDLFVPLIGRSLRIIVPVIGIFFIIPLLGLPPELAAALDKAGSVLVIIAVAAILSQSVRVGEKAVLARYDITVADNLQARKIYTQVHMLGRTLYVVIGLFSLASILMLFEEVRRFGTSILASAGVVGIIIGFAAQKTISNLFAGFQLAMTQPIRLDDVVIVEGEWGRIEEITLTYVVIRLWDERRLVVPLSYFIEKPFQNWTRVSADLMGSVFVWVDYTLPVEETRAAVRQMVESSKLWDRRFWNLQVSDATERTMQLRVLVTAADSTKAWDLRCEIREKLIAYVRQHHPQSLPQLRASFDGIKSGPTSSA